MNLFVPLLAQQPAQNQWMGFVPIILMVVVFYFILIRPQQKKQKEHALLLKTVRPGDKIVTSGGILGVIITVKENTVMLRSSDAKFEVRKSAIAEVVERSGEESQS